MMRPILSLSRFAAVRQPVEENADSGPVHPNVTDLSKARW
jgi:hypothetical protein